MQFALASINGRHHHRASSSEEYRLTHIAAQLKDKAKFWFSYPAHYLLESKAAQGLIGGFEEEVLSVSLRFAHNPTRQVRANLVL